MMGQPFARKLIRPFGFVTDEDLQNELNAINRICTRNHRNIVNILRHDHVQNSPFYYIDMQFCDINLDDYIYKPWPESLSGTSKFFRSGKPTIPIEWTILAEIVSGLEFIHHLGYVHRDLKPRNSITPLFSLLMINSTLLPGGRYLETRRFRSHCGRGFWREIHYGVFERNPKLSCTRAPRRNPLLQ